MITIGIVLFLTYATLLWVRSVWNRLPINLLFKNIVGLITKYSILTILVGGMGYSLLRAILNHVEMVGWNLGLGILAAVGILALLTTLVLLTGLTIKIGSEIKYREANARIHKNVFGY